MSYSYLLNQLKNGSFFGHYSELGFLPNPDRILSNTANSYEALRELKYDAHLWSCIQSRKSGVLNLDYSIVAHNKFIEEEISGLLMNIDITQLFRDILEAPLFGFQPLEIIWEFTKGKRMKYYPKSIIPLKQNHFMYNTKGELLINSGPGYNSVPEYKIINAQYEASAINPYGESLLSKCYWPIKFKNGGIKLWITFMEKFGMPYITGKFTRGSSEEESESLLENLDKMSEGSVFVAPNDIDIDIIESKRADATSLYKELIKNCNNEISKAILSQTLTTELDMGSYAAAQTHFKIRKEVINSDARIIESCINKVISYIMKINYSNYEAPVFRFKINDADDNYRIDRDIKLSQNNLLEFTKDYWKRTYGFSDNDLL